MQTFMLNVVNSTRGNLNANVEQSNILGFTFSSMIVHCYPVPKASVAMLACGVIIT